MNVFTSQPQEATERPPPIALKTPAPWPQHQCHLENFDSKPSHSENQVLPVPDKCPRLCVARPPAGEGCGSHSGAVCVLPRLHPGRACPRLTSRVRITPRSHRGMLRGSAGGPEACVPSETSGETCKAVTTSKHPVNTALQVLQDTQSHAVPDKCHLLGWAQVCPSKKFRLSMWLQASG